VYFNDKEYGGYPVQDYTVQVGYTGRDESWIDWVGIDFDSDKESASHLDKLLLGRRASFDIKDGAETIVYKGERIARLHLSRIRESWDSIRFDRTPWAKEILDLKRDAHRRQLKEELREGSNAVRVSFRFKNSPQEGGRVVVSPKVAEWLSSVLFAAAKGDLEVSKAKVRVKKGVIKGLKGRVAGGSDEDVDRLSCTAEAKDSLITVQSAPMTKNTSPPSSSRTSRPTPSRARASTTLARSGTSSSPSATPR
jgi:hypothetical protein